MTIKSELLRSLGTELRKAGYLKNQQAGWKQGFEEGHRLISLQMSRYNDESEGGFTVSIGVLFSKVDEIFCRAWGRKPSKTLDVTMGVPYERVGWIAEGCQSSYRDIWWNYDPSVDISALGEEVGRFLVSKCVPVLSEFRCMRDVSDLYLGKLHNWQTRTPPLSVVEDLKVAVVHCLSGREVEGRELFETIKSRNGMNLEFVKSLEEMVTLNTGAS